MIAAEPMAGEFSNIVNEPLKLLFVDDDPILREFALANLASPRGSVAVAADGAEALAAIARDRPDLVLLDLKMPKVDGFEVLHALRADETTRRLPVIVITGRDDDIAIDRAFSEGATSFLVKPINWQILAYQIGFVDRARRTELDLVDRIDEIKRRERELEATSAELRAALRAAAAASEAKSEFLAAMSHELRTPLNAIIGFSQVLDAETFGPLGNARYREYARDILNSGSHLLSLVNDVLEYSRGDVAKPVLEEEEFAPAEVIEEALRLVSRQAMAGNVTLSAASPATAARLRGDRRRIRQVLINLLSNAVKFTPAGGNVAVTVEGTAAGLAIIVSDTGIGIAEKDLAKALEPFGQVDSRIARKYEGVGLGLPLSKQIVELHGGRLDIASRVDVGTTVTVTFPERRVVRLHSADRRVDLAANG
jgi:signal transduction histidine kinase